MLRAQFNSNKYQFPLRESSAKVNSKNEKPNTNRLDAMLNETQKTLYDLELITQEITEEENKYLIIKNQLNRLNRK